MIKPIEKTRLAKEISNSILEMVKTDQWAAGTKIPTEMELAAAFSVSRNVIRESIKSLELLGVLESKVAKGTFVTLRAKENMVQTEFWEILRQNVQIQELLEIRLIVEPELAYYAAKRRTEEDMVNMREFLNGNINVGDYASYGDYFEYTYRFHLLIAHAAKNRVMEKFLESVYGQIKQVEALEFIVEKHIYNNQVGHDRILCAIEEQNASKAKKLMFDHIYPVYAYVQE